MSGLEDYVNRPIPPQALNDPRDYDELRVRLNQAFADNANGLTILSHLIRIADDVVSLFAGGVHPLAVIQAALGDDALLREQMAAQHAYADTIRVRDSTGGVCPLMTALKGIASQLGESGIATLRNTVGQWLDGFRRVS